MGTIEEEWAFDTMTRIPTIRAAKPLHCPYSEGAAETGIRRMKEKELRLALGRLRSLRAGDFASEALRTLVVVLATRLSVAGYSKMGHRSRPGTIWTDLDRDMDDVMEQLRQEFDLSNVDQAVDDIVAVSRDRGLHQDR